jgi:hypothetical protein
MNKISSSLFHFKTKFEYLQNIIENGFEFRPYQEELPLLGYPRSIFYGHDAIKYIQIPFIVCFCDLPLSMSQDHRKQYGEYAIAMTKQWGMANKITPIRYIHENSPGFEGETYNKILDLPSHLSEHDNNIFHLLTYILRERSNIEAPSEEDFENLPEGMKNVLKMANLEFNKILSLWHEVMNYVRKYEGDWEDRVSENITHRIFYEEREWRAATNEKDAKLNFTFKDITHLIVNTENERNILGEQIIKRSRDLEVEDERKIWCKIHIGEDLYRDI